jgi:hypothetical protein
MMRPQAFVSQTLNKSAWSVSAVNSTATFKKGDSVMINVAAGVNNISLFSTRWNIGATAKTAINHYLRLSAVSGVDKNPKSFSLGVANAGYTVYSRTYYVYDAAAFPAGAHLGFICVDDDGHSANTAQSITNTRYIRHTFNNSTKAQSGYQAASPAAWGAALSPANITTAFTTNTGNLWIGAYGNTPNAVVGTIDKYQPIIS